MPYRHMRSLQRRLALIIAVGISAAMAISCAIVEPPHPSLDMLASGGGPGLFLATLGPSEPPASGAISSTSNRRTAQQVAGGSAPADTPEIPLEEKDEELAEYDPWEPFNEKIFSLNRQVDRYVLKPAATAWNTVVPDRLQESLGNAFDNLSMPRRLVNNLMQLKMKGAGQELARFLLNSTVGFAGFFDVAKHVGLEKSEEDTGQTLGTYGVGPGPYVILPLLPPLTVRDGFGYAIDGALDPLNYFLPFGANVGRKAGSTVNERSLNLELFEGIEESVFDLYSAVRSAYLQRRQRAIEE